MEDKKDLLSRIKDNYNKLSKGQKLIATYVMDNYDKVAFMTASKLGDNVGVSESTVVRFANALGYKGYPNLQKELQELIKTKLTTIQRVELSNAYKDQSFFKKVMQSDVENIMKTIDELDTEKFNEVVDKVVKAKTVYVFGLRSSTVIAQYLAFYLNYMLDNVKIVPSGINDVMDQLISISEDDVFIGLSFPRYSKKTYEVIKFVRERNATVVGITDSQLSPINEFADITLIAKSNMASFIDSLVAPMSLVNALIIAISTVDKQHLTDKLNALESTWKKYDTYIDK